MTEVLKMFTEHPECTFKSFHHTHAIKKRIKALMTTNRLNSSVTDAYVQEHITVQKC